MRTTMERTRDENFRNMTFCIRAHTQTAPNASRPRSTQHHRVSLQKTRPLLPFTPTMADFVLQDQIQYIQDLSTYHIPHEVDVVDDPSAVERMWHGSPSSYGSDFARFQVPSKLWQKAQMLLRTQKYSTSFGVYSSLSPFSILSVSLHRLMPTSPLKGTLIHFAALSCPRLSTRSLQAF